MGCFRRGCSQTVQAEVSPSDPPNGVALCGIQLSTPGCCDWPHQSCAQVRDRERVPIRERVIHSRHPQRFQVKQVTGVLLG